MSDGREIVREARELVEGIIGEMKAVEGFSGQGFLNGVEAAFVDLGHLENRPTLRTQRGTSLSYPVMEAATILEEAFKGYQTHGEKYLEEVKFRAAAFVDAVNGLKGGLQSKTIILT